MHALSTVSKAAGKACCPLTGFCYLWGHFVSCQGRSYTLVRARHLACSFATMVTGKVVMSVRSSALHVCIGVVWDVPVHV
eukprot:3903990-Amphidinium_carterae.1